MRPLQSVDNFVQVVVSWPTEDEEAAGVVGAEVAEVADDEANVVLTEEGQPFEDGTDTQDELWEFKAVLRLLLLRLLPMLEVLLLLLLIVLIAVAWTEASEFGGRHEVWAVNEAVEQVVKELL